MIFLRSTLFNLAFYSWTALCCVGFSWSLLLPRRTVVGIVTWYFGTIAWLERHVLNLDYEVRGREHLPAGTGFILAAKHQSAWETFKLHLILGDPAIVLKRELAEIPVWGTFARHIGMIPIDRRGGPKAVSGMRSEARTAAAAGRPIVIFPQGTRVAPGDSRPYRQGIGLLYHELGLPVVPMALNSGVYWPRRRWTKRPGRIVIEFLPPIPPGLPRADLVHELALRLETATDRLVRAAGGPPTQTIPDSSRSPVVQE